MAITRTSPDGEVRACSAQMFQPIGDDLLLFRLQSRFARCKLDALDLECVSWVVPGNV